MKKWFVVFPTYRYNEDVKALAKANNLQIVDAQFDDGSGVKNGPKLTIKGEAPKSKPTAKAEKESE
jgi:hypothetical protein